jgi:hypothetical protein
VVGVTDEVCDERWGERGSPEGRPDQGGGSHFRAFELFALDLVVGDGDQVWLLEVNTDPGSSPQLIIFSSFLVLRTSWPYVYYVPSLVCNHRFATV